LTTKQPCGTPHGTPPVWTRVNEEGAGDGKTGYTPETARDMSSTNVLRVSLVKSNTQAVERKDFQVRKGGRGRTQKPGQIVSVGQLVSPTPGLIAQISGFLTTKRYKYATIYVDQCSRMGFVYLQKTASAEETVEGKKAFEAFARRHGVRVSNYHADNGIFKAHQWMEACRRDQQGITFAGVNAHHQNGHAESRIRELQEMARAMMNHANARWKDSITPNLWPYAVRNANEANNHTPSFQDPKRRTPIDLFAGTKVSTNPKHWKPFESPVYVSENELQGRRPFHKWRRRSKPGVYLGKSPKHGRNVSLVLSRETGLVSPQFHVAFDPTFDTVKDITTKSMRQIRAGFVAQRERTRRLHLKNKFCITIIYLLLFFSFY
jgi:hypothetical protein